MALQVVEPQVDVDLFALDAPDFDFGDTGQTLERLLDFQVDEIVGIAQVAPGCDLALDDRFIVRAPVSDEDLVDIVGQFLADLLHLLPYLRAQPVHVLAPVKSHADKDLAIAGPGHQALNMGNRAQGFFKRLGNRLLNLAGCGIRVRHPNPNKRKGDVRRENERNLRHGHQSKDDERYEDHAHRHGVADGKLRQAMASLRLVAFCWAGLRNAVSVH